MPDMFAGSEIRGVIMVVWEVLEGKEIDTK